MMESEIVRFALQYLLQAKDLEERLHAAGEHTDYPVSQTWNHLHCEGDPRFAPLPAKHCPSSAEIKEVLRQQFFS